MEANNAKSESKEKGPIPNLPLSPRPAFAYSNRGFVTLMVVSNQAGP